MSKTIHTRILTEYRVPVDALRLNEDLQALREILRLLDCIDDSNVAEDRIKGGQMLRFVRGQIKMAERYAVEKLKKEYLLPRKKKL